MSSYGPYNSVFPIAASACSIGLLCVPNPDTGVGVDFGQEASGNITHFVGKSRF